MNYLTLPNMSCPVDIFAICQAHDQLESDYNVGGILWERPSNKRRNASTGVQLSRMRYQNPFGHVDICAEPDENEDSLNDDVRGVYMLNVLNWGLPMDDDLRAAIARRFVPEFLETFPTWRK